MCSVANAYTRWASVEGMRTHPCDAGYPGTIGYSCSAKPPEKVPPLSLLSALGLLDCARELGA